MVDSLFGILPFYFTASALHSWCHEIWSTRFANFLKRRRDRKRHTEIGEFVESAMEEINTIKMFSGMESEAKLKFTTVWNDECWKLTVKHAEEQEDA